MEKREQGKTITIKINGKHQAFDDHKQKLSRRQGQLIDKNTAEPNIVEDEKNIANEKLPTSETDMVNETAASEERKEEQFNWILPEPSKVHDLEEYQQVDEPKTSNQKISKPKKPSFKFTTSKTKINRGIFATIFFAVFLAVILGTSFGFTMLKLVFIEKPIDNNPAIPATTIPQEQQANNEKTGTSSLTLPTISTWVVQEGAYSNSESAKSVVSDLRDKGLSAVIFEGDKSFILLGVVGTKEQAKELGAELAKTDINEPFSKEISTGGKVLKGINDQEKMFLEAFPDLFAAITNAATKENIADSDVDNINEQANKLKEIRNIENKQIASIKAHSDAAIKNIQSIAKKPDKKQSSELQQHLLTILSTYQALK